MAYYKSDGTIWTGETHTMGDNRVMTGATHTADSVEVFVTNPNETSNTNPHVTDNFAPLETMTGQAIRRFGDFSPATLSGDAALMFIEFANMIIDEVRMHPYWDGTELDYYEHMQETRPIPDTIMIAGLLFHYSQQQASEKSQSYGAAYIRVINNELWRRANGNTAIQMRVTDNGTNPRNYSGRTSSYNGTTS